MDLLINFVVAFVLIMIGFGIVYLAIKITEHRFTYSRRRAACNEVTQNEIHKELFNDLAKRTFVFYYSYALQNIIAILCNLFALIFSIVSLIGFQDDEVNEIISLFAVIFVVITIYIKPQKRSHYYLLAWRKMEKLTLDTLRHLECGNDTSETNKYFDNVSDQREMIERSITADDD